NADRPPRAAEALGPDPAARDAGPRPGATDPAARGDLQRLQLARVVHAGGGLHARPAGGRRRDVEARARAGVRGERRCLHVSPPPTARSFAARRIDGRRQSRRRPAVEELPRRGHSGHCEYFATATVLLLRAAGVPARYATGYSVQEWSRLERRYVVRARHAHSWALVWADGAWRDLDTTPPLWADEEAAA